MKNKQAFQLSSALRKDLGKLYKKLDDMSQSDREIFQGITSWVVDKNKVTKKQLSVLGRLYKRYLQDDEYVHHNWKIWKVS